MVHCSVLSVKNLCGCSGCSLRFVRKTEAWYYFFNYWIISSAGCLLASEIFTLGKILQLAADYHALQAVRTSFPGPIPCLFLPPPWWKHKHMSIIG